MVRMNRRDLCLSLPFLTLADILAAQSQPASAAGDVITDMSQGRVLPAGSTALKPNAHGAGVELMKSTLPNGTRCEMHVTMLKPGEAPHPPHRHHHMELMFIQRGNVTWTVEGKTMTAGPNDVLYAPPNALHGLVNTGKSEAQYTVFEVDHAE